MLRVPTDNRKIQTAAMPGARMADVSPDAYGAGLGQDIQRSAGIVQSQILAPEWDRANRARIDDATTKLAQKRLDLGNRLKQAQGEQAMEASEPLESEFETTRNELRQSLSNNAQRDAFDQDANRLGLGLRDSIDSHVIAQGEAVAEQKANARAETMLQSAVANRDDPIMAWQDAMDAQATIDEFDTARGVPVEARQAKATAIRSGFVAETISTLADDGNHVQARKWLERHQDALTPKDLARARKVVEVASTRGESQRIVDGIMAKPDASIESAMASAATISDPMLRAEVEQRAEKMLDLRKKAQSEQDQNNYRKAYDILADPKNPLGLDAIPPTLMATLRPDHQEHLRSYAKKDGEVKTAPRTWATLDDLATQNPAAFAKVDLLAHINDLSLADFKAFKERQNKLSGPSADDALVNDSVIGSVSSEYLTLNQLKKDTPEGVKFTQLLRAAAEAEAKRTRKPVTREMIEATAKSLMGERVIGSTWYGGDKMGKAFQDPVAQSIISPSASAWTPVEARRTRYALTDRGGNAELEKTIIRWGEGTDAFGMPNEGMRARFDDVLGQMVTLKDLADMRNVQERMRPGQPMTPAELLAAAKKVAQVNDDKRLTERVKEATADAPSWAWWF